MTSSKPAILFMGRIFEDAWGGVRQMAESLLRAAAPIAAAEHRRIEVLVTKPGLCPIESPWIQEVYLPQFANNKILWDHWTVPNYANRQERSVLHNIKLVLPERLKIPGFTTIHDLMYFPQPTKYDWREYLWTDSLYMQTMVRRSVRRSVLTAVDSDYTGEDARDLFPEVDPDRFRTIHLGVNAERFAPRPMDEEDQKLWQELESLGLRKPYVLHTGGLSRRKNVRLLALAFERFQRHHPEFQLAITGGAKPTMRDPKLQRSLNMLPLGQLVRLGKVSERALELLYQNAEFYVFPSLYEGFGLPILEAQAAQCPVIAAGVTSLPEVGGDSVLTIDPKSPRSLLDAMEEMVQPGTREALIAKGLANVERFPWEKTAREWMALADEVYERFSS